MTFWVIAVLLVMLSGALMASAALRGGTDDQSAASYDLEVYRDQMAEIERDAARGVLEAEEAARVRTEIAHRILAADRRLQAPNPRVEHGTLFLPGTLIGLALAGSFALYWVYGAPGYGDLPLTWRINTAEELRAHRPGQAEAEASVKFRPAVEAPPAEYLALVERLRSVVSTRPGDLNGHQLLAQAEARLGDFAAAAQAQRTVLQIKGDAALSGDFTTYADFLVLAAGGYVSPEAERALGAALAQDPSDGSARYYWGLMHAQTGRPDLAFRVWESLWRAGPPQAPWIAPIDAQIEEMALRAGVSYEKTAPGGGNNAVLTGSVLDDFSTLSPAERLAQIEGMVGGLGQRLAEDGGSAEEWARLITSLGVLNRGTEAARITAEARQVFAGVPGALDMINRAAEQAGVP